MHRTHNYVLTKGCHKGILRSYKTILFEKKKSWKYDDQEINPVTAQLSRRGDMIPKSELQKMAQNYLPQNFVFRSW